MIDKIKALRNTPQAKIGGVLFFLITLAIIVVSIQKAQQYKGRASGTTGTTQTISGIATVVITDDFNKKSATKDLYLEYTLDSKNYFSKLNYKGPVEIKTGDLVSLTGTRTVTNEITVGTIQKVTSGGASTKGTLSQQAVPTGTGKKVAIIFLKWSNFAGKQADNIPATLDKAGVEATFNSVENYFNNQSNGKLTLNNTQADIYGWTVSNVSYSCGTFGNWTPSLSGGNPIDNFISTMGLASQNYQHYVIVMPMDYGCDSQAVGAFGGTRVRIPYNMFRKSTIEHELAHNFYAAHSSDHQCPVN